MSRRRRLAIEALESRLVLDSVGLDVADAAGSPLERVIVQLNDDVADPQQAAEALIQPFQGRLGHVYQDALKGFSVELPAAAISALQRNPAVKLVEPDVLVHAAGQTVPSGVDRIDAEPGLFNRTGDVDVDIAILDTGIYAGHGDLDVAGGSHFYTIATGPPRNRGAFQDENYDDDNGHGTHVAGIAGAIDEAPGGPNSTDGWGYVGVAPGARLWAVKVLDANGSGYVSDLVAGVDWVVDQGDIEVANMSLTAGGYSAALRTAIQNGVNQGVVFVAAAGNEYQDVYGADGIFGNSDDIFPASFPEVATISALSDTDGEPGGAGPLSSYGGADRNGDGYDDGLDDSFAFFSNYSESVVEDNPVISPGAAIDLILPGVDIWSTYTDGLWVQFSGTSQAAPHAAGLAALYIAEHGPPTDAAGVYALRQALIDAGQDQASGMRLTYLDTEPDTAHENLGWAGPADAHDVAVSAITAPGSVLAGDAALIEVAVQNQGTYDETFDVTLTSDNGTPDNADDDFTMATWTPVVLTPGTSTTLSTFWETNGADLGDYTLTALAGPVSEEVDTADNSKSTVVTVESSVTDVAIAAVEASASVMQGDLADVLVTIENVGNQDVGNDVNVTLVSDNATASDTSDDVVIDTQTITGGLAAGGSTTLTFSWDTAGAALGDHTLTASHDFLDDNAANDSNGTGVTVQEVGATMHVADLDGSAVIFSKNWWQAEVTITVVDAFGEAVAGAEVTGVWSDGTTTVSGATDGDGQTTVTSATLHRRITSTTFEVTAITHDTLTYEPDGTSITVSKDATSAVALAAGNSDGLEAMCREIAWHYALQQQQRTRNESQQDESTSPQAVDYLLMQDR